MRSKKIKDTHFIRLERGEKIVESVKDFCSSNDINCSYFSGIGALNEVELAHYIVEDKKYKNKRYLFHKVGKGGENSGKCKGFLF